jgi:hypothetical protein
MKSYISKLLKGHHVDSNLSIRLLIGNLGMLRDYLVEKR